MSEERNEDGSIRKAGQKINRLRDRLGADEYDRVAESGLQGGLQTPGIDSSKKRYSAAEVTAELRNRGDRSVNGDGDSMQKYFQGLVDDGSKFNNKAQAKLEGIGVTFGGGSDGGGDSNPDPGGDDTPPGGGGGGTTPPPSVGPIVTIPEYESPYTPPDFGGIGGVGDFIVGRDLNQNVGKTGDMTTNIEGSTFGDNAVVGNDNSVTIGSNDAGNKMFGGSLDTRRQGKARAGAFGGLRLS